MRDSASAAEHAPPKAEAYPLDVAAVSAHLDRRGMKIDRIFGAKRLSGGLSNLNYLVMLDGRKAVLRRPPAGELAVGAHDMAREHKVLSRLSRAFPPAPDSFHLCEDVGVIGVPFQLLEYREGLVVRGDRLPPGFADAASRCALSRELVQTLAALHAVDAAKIGLGGFGRPDGFFRRNVEGWLRRASSVVLDDATIVAVDKVGVWLKRNEPASFRADSAPFRLQARTIACWDLATGSPPCWIGT